MTESRSIDGRISSWMEAQEAGTHYPDRLLAAAFEETRALRQASPARWPSLPRWHSWPAMAGAGIAVVVVVAIAVAELRPGVSGPGAAASPTPGASPSQAAVATPTTTRTPIVIPPHDGVVLGWSRDATRFLVQKDDENLFLVFADGTQAQLTTQLTGISRFPGSSRPAGASISPDGTRVVFAGLTKPVDQAVPCHDGGIFAIDAAGGQAELLFSSRIPANGIVRYPTFSPDGTQIAFADGYCDSDHHLWVMNADGTGAREVLSPDDTPVTASVDYGFGLGGAHVQGVAWSPDGSRIAIRLDNTVWTVTPSGTDPARVATWLDYCWQALPCEVGQP